MQHLIALYIMCNVPADDLIDCVHRYSETRPLHREILAGEHRACRNVARRYDAPPSKPEHLRFGIGDGLFYTGDISAESTLYAYDPPATKTATLLVCSNGSALIATMTTMLKPMVAAQTVASNLTGPTLARFACV